MSEDEQTISIPGEVLVDAPFTAPELFSNPSSASSASDIFALGVLWYYLACFPKKNPKFNDEKMDAQQVDAQVDALSLPEAARILMKKMLKRVPGSRPQKVEEVL